METTNIFEKKKIVQIHDDDFVKDEVIILNIFKELGYDIHRGNEMLPTADVYLNTGNLWDGGRFFDCPTMYLMDNFVKSKYMSEYLEKVFNNAKCGEELIKLLVGESTEFNYIDSFSEKWDEEDGLFNQAMEITSIVMKAVVGQIVATSTAEDEIKELVKETASSDVIVFKKFLPWNKHLNLVAHYKYIIYPVTGKWGLYCVPESVKFDLRQKTKLPKEWATNKPPGCTFAHMDRMYAEFKSVEEALRSLL